MNGHQKQKEQSARMIEDALFVLMEEKGYSRISVSEIVERADISRRTFYRLYKEKDDVLRNYFCKLCTEYISRAPALECYDIGRIAREYFCFWHQYRNFLLLMHKCGLDGMIYDAVSRASGKVMRNRIGEKESKNFSELEYFADYSTGGFLLLLQRWIMTGMQGTPEEYAEAVSGALMKFIRPAGE